MFWREFPFLVVYIVVDGVSEQHTVLFCKEESFIRVIFLFYSLILNYLKIKFHNIFLLASVLVLFMQVMMVTLRRSSCIYLCIRHST